MPRPKRGQVPIMRRLYALALAVLVAVGAAVVAPTAPSPAHAAAVTFADVPWGSPFYREVSWLAEQGISTGYPQPDGSRLFKPDDSIGRDAMAADRKRAV